MGTKAHEATSAETKAVGQELAAVLPNTGPWYKQKHLIRLNFCILSMIMFSSSNGYDGSMMNGLLALPQWGTFMGNPSGAWLGFINAVYSLGSVIVYPVAAWMCNKYGRKPGIWIGYGFLVLGTALQTAANGPAAFILARVFLGCASGFFLSVPLLIAENAFPTQRGVASSLYNCGWYVGSIVAAWVTFGTRNMDHWAWRVPSLLQAATPLFALPGFIMTHESPRWLVSVDRVDEARRILADDHCGGDLNAPLVTFEITEIEATLLAEKEANASTSWSDLWSTPGNRHRLFISVSLGIFGQWVGNGVVSYYLAMVLATVGITSVTHQTLISGCLQIWNLIWAVAAASMVDKIGRRVLFLSSGAIMLVSYIIITGLSGSFAATGNSATGTTVIPFLFIYFMGYDIALTPLMVSYPVEIWPFRLRAKGLSVTLLTTLMAVFFNIFINPIALDAIQWKYYFVFVAVLVAMIATIYFYYPETRGRTLENMAHLFDGDDAVAGGITAQDILKGGVEHDERDEMRETKEAH
ncbi:general substrate transporter [Dactylonectria estremocensis]|uniref:General substrate transporter n=1 Tax=Dactylonectria estremocensis TaxID=1079267 RepID=A0A9P9EYV6_9HYPO|nr:general substrate transporter [Dactylonectria estremocensis]